MLCIGGPLPAIGLRTDELAQVERELTKRGLKLRTFDFFAIMTDQISDAPPHRKGTVSIRRSNRGPLFVYSATNWLSDFLADLDGDRVL
jgi:hypothetical protein